MTLVVLLAAGCAFAIWRIQRATTPARPQPVTPTGLGTGQEHCSVAFCHDAPTIRIYASNEWWDFCQVHGIPYLTSELAS